MPKQFTATNFPETLFVKEEDDGDGGTFHIASADPGELAEMGVAVLAAEYRLARAGIVIKTEIVLAE